MCNQIFGLRVVRVNASYWVKPVRKRKSPGQAQGYRFSWIMGPRSLFEGEEYLVVGHVVLF